MLGISEKLTEWHSAAKYTLSTNLGHNLDSLRAVHDFMASKLNFKPRGWNETCDDCNETELENKYSIYDGNLAGEEMGNAVGYATGQSNCIHRLKKAMAMIRRAIKKLEHEANRMTTQLKKTTIEGEAPYA